MSCSKFRLNFHIKIDWNILSSNSLNTFVFILFVSLWNNLIRKILSLSKTPFLETSSCDGSFFYKLEEDIICDLWLRSLWWSTISSMLGLFSLINFLIFLFFTGVYWELYLLISSFSLSPWSMIIVSALSLLLIASLLTNRFLQLNLSRSNILDSILTISSSTILSLNCHNSHGNPCLSLDSLSLY